MSGTLIQPNTCSTCPLKEWEGREIVCRSRPPSVTPILSMTPQGVQVMGMVTTFPRPQPTEWCWDHPGLIRPKTTPQVLS